MTRKTKMMKSLIMIIREKVETEVEEMEGEAKGEEVGEIKGEGER